MRALREGVRAVVGAVDFVLLGFDRVAPGRRFVELDLLASRASRSSRPDRCVSATTSTAAASMLSGAALIFIFTRPIGWGLLIDQAVILEHSDRRDRGAGLGCDGDRLRRRRASLS